MLSKSLQRRIDQTNMHIKHAITRDILGISSFGSTWETLVKFTEAIKISPKGNQATLVFSTQSYNGQWVEQRHIYNLNRKDPYDFNGVSDFRHIMTQIIKAVKKGELS